MAKNRTKLLQQMRERNRRNLGSNTVWLDRFQVGVISVKSENADSCRLCCTNYSHPASQALIRDLVTKLRNSHGGNKSNCLGHWR